MSGTRDDGAAPVASWPPRLTLRPLICTRKHTALPNGCPPEFKRSLDFHEQLSVCRHNEEFQFDRAEEGGDGARERGAPNPRNANTTPAQTSSTQALSFLGGLCSVLG